VPHASFGCSTVLANVRAIVACASGLVLISHVKCDGFHRDGAMLPQDFALWDLHLSSVNLGLAKVVTSLNE
jgi:hypothetical protein